MYGKISSMQTCLGILMNRTYLIGAGFSYDAGVPLQKDIINRILNIETSNLNWEYSYIPKYLKDFVDFIRYIKNGNEIDNITLEDLFTFIDENLNELTYIGKYSPQEIFHIREVLNDLVLFVINTTITDDILMKYVSRVEKLISDSGTISFISFNWDSLLEKALIELHRKINYGIPVELLPTISRQKSVLSQTKSALKVIKPHGSLNWGICQTCRKIMCVFDSSRLLNCPYCENRNLKNDDNVKIGCRLEPILLSPTYEKKTKILALKSLNQQFYDNLIEADDLTFIGYSLPISDHDIRMVLIKTNVINPVKKVKVILKTNDLNEQHRLKTNYLTIYSENKIEFNWNGFY